ncbi:rhodanese-like domain-containing protein [Hydrogenimonas sp. SS33]|uniref:rhodanese-like domain-containing protein n=1 Tax=Hydrogenimonas leucolamina TaxID=2954236 RepID=UPI00336BE91D
MHTRFFFLLFLLLPWTLLAGVKSLDIATFEKMQRSGVPVVDIRTPAEWRQTGIIPGSHTIMFFGPDGRYDVPAFLEALKNLGIDKKSPFILVCRSASRTRMVGNFLSGKLGYEKVYDLQGGILNWMAHHKPLVPYRR